MESSGVQGKSGNNGEYYVVPKKTVDQLITTDDCWRSL